MPIDYARARALLDATFVLAEADLLGALRPATAPSLAQAIDTIFGSNTQAYREVLLGCALARIQDHEIDIRLPYIGLGPQAFNGRTLDERVVNPFLHDNRIPSSRGPYLNVFRRSIRFDKVTRAGVRDKVAYDALLEVLSFLEGSGDDEELQRTLRYLLFKFARLREGSQIPLARLQRISLEQCGALISGLLGIPSGGRIPMLLVVAAFRAVKEFFGLDWTIDYQGINVADSASSAGGDITILSGGQLVLAAEVTERPMDRTRIVATFNTKIAPNAIEDYLFFVRTPSLEEAARTQARQYFAQGHEVNFLDIKDWILMSLATMGRRGRAIFIRVLLELLDDPQTPRSVKMGWNAQIARLLDE